MGKGIGLDRGGKTAKEKGFLVGIPCFMGQQFCLELHDFVVELAIGALKAEEIHACIQGAHVKIQGIGTDLGGKRLLLNDFAAHVNEGEAHGTRLLGEETEVDNVVGGHWAYGVPFESGGRGVVEHYDFGLIGTAILVHLADAVLGRALWGIGIQECIVALLLLATLGIAVQGADGGEILAVGGAEHFKVIIVGLLKGAPIEAVALWEGGTPEFTPNHGKRGEVNEHVGVGITTGNWVTATFHTKHADGVWHGRKGK